MRVAGEQLSRKGSSTKMEPEGSYGTGSADELKFDKPLITGASGDIGAAIARYLHSRGLSPINVIRSKTSRQSFNIRADIDLPDKNFLYADLFQRERIQQTLSKSSVFYYFAGVVGLEKATEEYEEIFRINGLAAIGIIKWVEQVNPAVRFIFASTQRIYDIKDRPEVQQWIEGVIAFIEQNSSQFASFDYASRLQNLSENILRKYSFPHCVYPYELSKLLVEHYLEKSQLTNYLAIRISNVYGPGTRSGRTIQRMIESRLNGNKTDIHREKRDYVYIDDAAEILYKARLTNGDARVVDLASGNMTTTEELWNLIVKHTPEAVGCIHFTGKASCQRPQSEAWSRNLLGRDFTYIETGVRNQIDDLRYIALQRKASSTCPVMVIDAGGTTTRTAIWNGKNGIDDISFFSTPHYASNPAADVQQTWLNTLKKSIDTYRKRYPDLARVAISFAGPVNADGDLINSSVIWGQQSKFLPRKKLEETFGLPVIAVNDLTAAVTRYGKDQKFSHFRLIALLTVSSGVGTKLFDITSGSVVIDRAGRSGEIGHVVVDTSRSAIKDEAIKGELNAYASGRGASNIARRFAKKTRYKKLYEQSLLKKLIKKETIDSIERDKLTRLIVHCIHKKDTFSLQVMKEGIRYLAGVLNTFILQNSPDIIILMGGFSENIGEPYRTALVQELQVRRVYGYSGEELNQFIQFGEKDDNNCLIGAGFLAFEPAAEQTPSVPFVQDRGYVKEVAEDGTELFVEAFAPNPVKYRDYFTEGVFDISNKLLAQLISKRNTVVIVEKMLRQNFRDRIKAYIGHINISACSTGGKVTCLELEGGEHIKNIDAVIGLINYSQDINVDRKGILVAVGGGALMDMVGLVASLFRRGIEYIRIPTTLLGQVDAAVGVKVGIDYRTAKNFLGAFYPPSASITDTSFLATLPERHIRSGIAEIIKIALVSDASLFKNLELFGKKLISTGDMPSRDAFIKDAAVELLKHLQQDFFERNLMRHVDFGHVLAHKFESMTNYELLHGEAVAIDILLSAYIARSRATLNEADFQRILTLHRELGFPFFHPAITIDQTWQGILESIAHKGGRLMMVVPRGVGRTTFIDSLSKEELNDALAFLRDQQIREDEKVLAALRTPKELGYLNGYIASLPANLDFYHNEAAMVLSDLYQEPIKLIVNIASNLLASAELRASAMELLKDSLFTVATPADTLYFKGKTGGAEFVKEKEAFNSSVSVRTQTEMEIANKLNNKKVFIFDIDDTLAVLDKPIPDEMINILLHLLMAGKTVAISTLRGFMPDDFTNLKKGYDLGILKSLFEHPTFTPQLAKIIILYTIGSTHKFTFKVPAGGTPEINENKDFFDRYKRDKVFVDEEKRYVNRIHHVLHQVDTKMRGEFGLSSIDSTFEDFQRTKIFDNGYAILYAPNTHGSTVSIWKLRILLSKIKEELQQSLPSAFYNDLFFRVALYKGQGRKIVIVKRLNRKNEVVFDFERQGFPINTMAFFDDEFESDGVARSLMEIQGLTLVSTNNPMPGDFPLLQLLPLEGGVEEGPDRLIRIFRAYFEHGIV